jgi:serine/threonine protein phosphatase PrpC
MKEISFPYNFKKEVFIPPSINEVEKINNIIRKKKMKINKFNMSVVSNLPFLKYKKSLLSKNEENKNSILKPKKLLRMNRSLINITKKSVSELFNANLNINKKKKESVNEQFKFKYRNFNFYLITKLIETYENMYQNQEINIKITNNSNSLDKYSKIFPRKIDLYNFNVINSITDHNTFSIEGTISKNENQDKHFFYEDFLLIKNFYLFGICDGHGKYGDAIAKTVSFLYPSFIAYILIEDNLNKKKQDINEMIINLFKLEESPKEIKDIFLLRYITDKFEINYKIFPFISSDMNKLSHLLYESCHYVQKDLTQRYNYNIEYSGTTLCSAFLLGKILYVSNIGNSRIILGNYNSNLNKWNSRQLSLEHTPTSPDEIKRIMAINSKVTIARNENEEEIEPYQTCDKDKESVLPGISLSRSIGDSFAKDLGVIYEPETFKYNLNINDKIIVVGSYGFWVYMNNDEVINIIGKYYEEGIKAEEASVNIVEIAKNKWIEENEKNPSFFTNKYKFGNNGINGKENKKDSFAEYNSSHIYDSQKEKKYYYDDITCMIIYLDIK